ncbi:MAG: hypothetical protein ABJL49_05405 [Parasphingorhabdus sp.]|uniref:hypothetical protein n=1 Tax=Alphaproteobacteria TaxID=28211 RepID=UPI0032632453
MKIKALRPQMTASGAVEAGDIVTVSEDAGKKLLMNKAVWAEVVDEKPAKAGKKAD